MDHLYASHVRVERIQLVVLKGRALTAYAQATDEDPEIDALLHRLPCRLDLGFIRQGKDIPLAPVAGRAPDRMGVMFTYAYAPLKAGDRIVTIPNHYGLEPVKGTFDIRAVPDEAMGFANAHHIEVQITETANASELPFEEPTN